MHKWAGLLLVGFVVLCNAAFAGPVAEDDVKLVFARPFELNEPYELEMRSDRPLVNDGWLVVVQADPELTVPSQSFAPILFVGEWPVEVMNTGRAEGFVVAIVPSTVVLDSAPFFFADPEVLPESLSPRAARSLSSAAQDLVPRDDHLEEALAAGHSPIQLSNRHDLHLAAADLVERYAPDEQDVVNGIRAPLVVHRSRMHNAHQDKNQTVERAAPVAGSVRPESASKGEPIAGLITAELAGNPLATFPYFEYARGFNAGSALHVAVDAGRFPVAGETAEIYVVHAKTRDEWHTDPSLVDVSGGGAETVSFVDGDIQQNIFEVDSGILNGDAGAGLGVGYDVVVDLDRNGQLGSGDLIDGLGDEAGLYSIHDLTLPGPLAVTEITYSGGSFLGQNTFYPTDIASMGQAPLVVVSHGNGHHYLWYDHIGHHLASYGYIVMSHQNNTQPGIESASTTTLTNTDYFLSHLDTIAGGVMQGHVDSNRIVWIGHSRGGEGIVRAYHRIFSGAWTPSQYSLADLKLLSSMAPTNYLGFNSSHPHRVPYHVWIGGADADVSGCPWADHRLSLCLLDRAEGDRQSISLHGAGHGDFHNSGGSSVATGPCLLGRATTHALMRGYLLPLVEFYTKDNLPAEDFLWRQWESFRPIGAPTSSCVVVDLYYRPGDDARKLVIDDFQSEPSPDVSSSGGAVSYTVGELTEGRFDDENTNFTHTVTGPMNGMTVGGSGDGTRGIVFSFDGVSSSEIEFELVPGARDFGDWVFLTLRAAQATRHPLTTAELGDATFSVSLVDGNAVESSINIGAYGGGLEEPYQRSSCGSGVGWANEFETIRLRVTDFLHNGSALDLSDIRKVVLHFGPAYGSSSGRFTIDQLELLGSQAALFADGFENGDAAGWSTTIP